MFRIRRYLRTVARRDARGKTARANIIENPDRRSCRTCVRAWNRRIIRRRFHADAITHFFLRRDTATHYGIMLALPIIIVNVILRNAGYLTHSLKRREKETEK